MTFVIINAQIIIICFTFIRSVIIRRKFWNLIKTFHKIISETSWELIDPLLCLFSISFWYCHIQCDIRMWGAYAEILEGRGEIQKLGQNIYCLFPRSVFLKLKISRYDLNRSLKSLVSCFSIWFGTRLLFDQADLEIIQVFV